MWLFGSNFFRPEPSTPHVSPSQINKLIETWGQESCRDEFLHELCYTGIPVCYRGTLWNLLSGNFLQITPELYSIFKERALRLSSISSKSQSMEEVTDASTSATGSEVDLETGNTHGKEESMNIICYDVPRTFTDIEDFHNNGPLAKNLEVILKTYACYRPDVGYVQGMSYLAATLVFYLDEFNAFKCLANILGRRMSFEFYQLKNDMILQVTSTFNFFFELHMPQLRGHFVAESVASEVFLLDWIMTIFSKTFPVDIAARLWDVYLLEGEVFIMRASLGILKLHESSLRSMDAGEIIRFLKRPSAGSTCPNQLLQLIGDISISKDAYDTIMMRNRMPSLVKGMNQQGIMETSAESMRSGADIDSCDSSVVNMLCPPFGVEK
eukprot:CAMPEP_0114412704 /NCGR_PEP_ID=MMETSP0103-20121206/468_1 /TAXON_ID=37642 ORGANISM="Paraphysomonas imperforata, Strain PA2" /NCGR_SAMPLE_ID=MMETSP0103 /ASSEMBLY_ACC=CAM_ASM_000201 /LENGTH=381 /DNA_ID=CAMNT_0001580739 /DNA_START=24 /DNA_END=1169 /DNA_ORIENTATION=-